MIGLLSVLFSLLVALAGEFRLDRDFVVTTADELTLPAVPTDTVRDVTVWEPADLAVGTVLWL